jgi:predicted dehydrogenase
MQPVNRRTFLQASALSAASLAASRRARAFDLNGKLRLAAIGTGNKGKGDLLEVAASPRVEVVALCDVDNSVEHLGWAIEKFPQAKAYTDFRRLLDCAHTFDAVTVATPDHMHAPIAVAAMRLGKHVFCEKPLTHTVVEARRMREVAACMRVTTQMGNQIQSHPAYRTAVKLIHDGVIGRVREVRAWQGGDMEWLPHGSLPPRGECVPRSLHWNAWLGVARQRPYTAKLYHPKNWRGWQEFGSGQLGDFGCHILDPIFMALELGAPTSVEADAPPLRNGIWTPRAKVTYCFPGTRRTAGKSLKLTWYDGRGRVPKHGDLDLPKDFKLPGAGSVLTGEHGTMVLPHWSAPQLFPVENFKDYKLPEMDALNHYTSWVEASLGDGKTTSNFNYAGPLTEAVLLGVVAIRFPHHELRWNSQAARICNHSGANARLSKNYRRCWPNPLD